MWNAQHADDLALARRAAGSDAAAWDEIVERHGAKIYNLAYRFSGLGTEAEDLTQDIFLKLYSSLDRYRGDVPLVAWALRLSRNLCIDHYRARRARRAGDHVPDEMLQHWPAAGKDPQTVSVEREQVQMVHDALGALPEAMATIVMLRDLQELTYEEISTFLDLPAGTVKSRLSRARKALVGAVEKRLLAVEPALGGGLS